MSNMNVNVAVDLVGNLQARAQQNSQALTQLGRTGSRSLGMLQRSAQLAAGGIDRLGNRYTALLTGGAMTVAVRQVGNLEERMERLGIQAGKSADDIALLTQQVYATAQAADIRVAPGQLLDAIDSIVEKTGDLAFAEDNIRNIGLAIQATGAEGGAIGDLLAEFQKMGITAPQQVMQALDVLNVQGKEGAFTLQNLASLGPRVITAYTALGHTGVPALREMGAALQVIRQGTGSSEMAATAFEATLRTLGDPQKIKMLERVGIAVYDPEKMANGVKAFRSIDAIMADIVKKSGGDITKIGSIFDAEAVRAFNAASGEFQRTGTLASLEKFMAVAADGTTTLDDAERAAQTFNASLVLLRTSAERFADSELAEPIKDFAGWVKELDPQEIQDFFNTAKSAAIGFGVVLGTLKLAQFGTNVAGIFRTVRGGSSGRAGGLGSSLGGMAPVPVYIVNAPAAAAAGSLAGGRAGRLGKLGGVLGAGAKRALFSPMLWGGAGGVAAAGALGYGAGSLLYQATANTRAMDGVGSMLASMAALLGSDEARAAQATRQAAEAQLRIEVDDRRVRVTRLKTENLQATTNTGSNWRPF